MSAPFDEKKAGQAPKTRKFTISGPPAKKTAEPVTVTPLPVTAPVQLTAHGQWLKSMTEAAAGLSTTDKESAKLWQSHDVFKRRPGLEHYQGLDALFGGEELVWRFTSRPSQEQMFVVEFAENKELLAHLTRVMARHAGQNVKDDKHVRLQSYCRNLGAFIGTAMSSGGDPYVRFIINNAQYLCAFRISDLARHEVSAQPALAKRICFAETEYVLVPMARKQQTPVFLNTLVTHVYKNPFLGCLQKEQRFNAKEEQIVTDTMKRENPDWPGKPDELGDAMTMPPEKVTAIATYYRAALKAASDDAIDTALRSEKQSDANTNYDARVSFAEKFGTILANELTPRK
jgi:hypothetical protein